MRLERYCRYNIRVNFIVKSLVKVRLRISTAHSYDSQGVCLCIIICSV